MIKKTTIELWISKVKLNLLESANFEQEVVEGLRRRFGSFGNENLELDIKYKGVPFLCFEIERISLYQYSQDEMINRLLTIKNFCLMN